MMRTIAPALAGSALLLALHAGAYPLDDSERTGITRLEAYERALPFMLENNYLSPGATLGIEDVKLGLVDRPGFQLPPPDPGFTASIRGLLGADASRYGITVLDISKPGHPRYAEINPDQGQNPASVGKIMVALGFFQALADAQPEIAARERLLRDTVITANGFIVRDTHTVPVWQPGDPKVVRRPIEEGDRGNLWTYLDWMLSASSNAAASMVQSQILLLEQYGSDYPVPDSQAAAFFANTPKTTLSGLLQEGLIGNAKRNGIDTRHLRQGSFFTRAGKSRVPGGYSTASARELMKYLVRMEQGKLVDAFSSLEIKRLLYLTDSRIRYANVPALRHAAVYFKSGSLYSCKQEAGFQCGKYLGNRYNFMNSIAVVETQDPVNPLRYIAVVLSNVLRRNSVEEHQELATRIHELMLELHPPAAGGEQRGGPGEEPGAPRVEPPDPSATTS